MRRILLTITFLLPLSVANCGAEAQTKPTVRDILLTGDGFRSAMEQAANSACGADKSCRRIFFLGMTHGIETSSCILYGSNCEGLLK